MINKPFTQSWVQALLLAADNPLARTVKPKLDWVDQVSRSTPDSNRAAQELFAFAASEGFVDLLHILPTSQPHWIFDRDDIFLYTQTAPVAGADPEATASFGRWLEALGLKPASYALTAEVASGDWTSLVRSEAVRLQHSLAMSAVTHASTMHLPCTARWDGAQWSVTFDQLKWIVVPYEEIPVTARPSISELRDSLWWAISLANDTIVAKKAPACTVATEPQPWYGCVDNLRELHAEVLASGKQLSPWLLKTWNCVWPVVYREQNRLRGLADIDRVRSEVKACLADQPRLTLWMFVFAKLVCQTQTGAGLGISVDYRD